MKYNGTCVLLACLNWAYLFVEWSLNDVVNQAGSLCVNKFSGGDDDGRDESGMIGIVP